MHLIRALLGRCSHCGGAIELAPDFRHRSITRCSDCGMHYRRRGVLRRWPFILVIVVLLTCIEYLLTRLWADVGTDRFFRSMQGWQLVLSLPVVFWFNHILRLRRIGAGELQHGAPSA